MLSDDLSELLNATVEVVDHHPLAGGCISEVASVTIRSPDARSWATLEKIHQGNSTAMMVIKRHSEPMVSNFRCEADGLRAIGETGVIRVPQVYAFGVIAEQAYLAMERIPIGSARSPSGGYSEFGRRLARMHRETLGDRIGWPSDNFLGSANQPNSACSSWDEFFATRRIGFQIKWAADQGMADQQLRSDCENIVDHMSDLLTGRDDHTSLLHGDLWSGNYLFDSQGQPALIDPAVYYGCREAEWGMIKLFGNCPLEFEDAYLSEHPMPDGWQRRVDIYLLYHQLNHLNLFGSSYADGCKRTAQQILKALN